MFDDDDESESERENTGLLNTHIQVVITDLQINVFNE